VRDKDVAEEVSTIVRVDVEANAMDPRRGRDVTGLRGVGNLEGGRRTPRHVARTERAARRVRASAHWQRILARAREGRGIPHAPEGYSFDRSNDEQCPGGISPRGIVHRRCGVTERLSPAVLRRRVHRRAVEALTRSAAPGSDRARPRAARATPRTAHRRPRRTRRRERSTTSRPPSAAPSSRSARSRHRHRRGSR
jgi:hypothetical protein